jgi:hypothetical protein
MTTAPLDFPSIWAAALPYHDFVAGSADEHRALWEGIYRLNRTPDSVRELRLPAGSRLLALAADWCGDAVNTLPALAKWAELTGVELRLLERDAWPQVMDRYLTNGSRSIPIVIVLDAAFHELGHWGPRPSELQTWVIANKPTMEKSERHKYVRRWYAQDKGATTIRDIVAAVGG